MSYEQAQWINLSEKGWVFSWWYVDNVSSLYMSNKFSPYLRNARIDGQSIIIRPWHDLFASLTAWSYPKWIWTYYRTVSSNDRLIVRHNTDATHKLYTITTTWTTTSILTDSNIASDNRMTFLNVWDVIYCMNGSDNLGKLSATTYTIPSTWISNFAPSFWVSFSGSFWASGWATNPNKLYKSVADSYENFSWTWSDSFDFEEQIKWLAENDKSLLIFTQNTLSVVDLWDFDSTNSIITYKTSKIQTQEWTNVHASIVTAWMNTYFLSSSNKILKVRRGVNVDWFEMEQLSERKYAWITAILKTLDVDQSSSFGYFCQKENLIKWFVKTTWATFNNLCIIYDLTKDAFLVDEQKYFYGWVFFKWVNYTISMIEPKVYKDEYSQTDEWTAIIFEYHSKDFYITDPTYKKVLWEARTLCFINELATLTQEIYMDWWLVDIKTIDKDNITLPTWWIWTNKIWTYEIWTEWDSESEELQEVTILRTKWNLNIIWKKIKLVYKCSSIASKIRLEDISLNVEQKPWLSNNLTT
jgi:hypothetical protein